MHLECTDTQLNAIHVLSLRNTEHLAFYVYHTTLLLVHSENENSITNPLTWKLRAQVVFLGTLLVLFVHCEQIYHCVRTVSYQH